MKQIIIPTVGLIFFLSAATFGFLETSDSPEAKPRSSVEIHSSLDLMTVNAFLRPEPFAAKDRTHCRAKQLGERLRQSQFDIIALNETFNEPDTRLLARQLKHSHPYTRLRRPTDMTLGVNGGLSLISRYPILESNTRRFEECNGLVSDCLASKGFLHAVIRISDRLKVNAITTHLDSGPSKGDRQARESQLKEIAEFIRTNDSTNKWPTFLMGDLNINGITSEFNSLGAKSEYARMIDILDQVCLDCLNKVSKPVDIFRDYWEEWLESSGTSLYANTVNCVGQRLQDCKSPKTEPSLRQRIDYIFHFSSPKKSADIDVQTLDTGVLPLENETCDTNYLSDHKAVTSSVVVRRARQASELSYRRHETEKPFTPVGRRRSLRQ
jgi:endonuclease/exonuclease/phosphatase family metal-dependent hydrolase